MRNSMLLACFAVFPACLDATTGDRADLPDGAAHAPPDAKPGETLAVSPAPCQVPGAALERIAEASGTFAIGRCGELAYWKEREGRSLELLSASHTRIASYPDPNGFSGRVLFSPSAHRLVATSLRSDLGFGDVVVGTFPHAAPFVVDATFDFGGEAELVFDANERLYVLARAGVGDQSEWVRVEGGTDLGPARTLASTPDRIFFTLAHDPHPDTGADATLVRLNVATGESKSLTELKHAWLEGSTMRTRQGFLATGDGTRVVLTTECSAFGAPTCTPTTERILDVTIGNALVSDVWWRAPMVGAGALVAGDSDAGAALLDRSGAVVTLPDHRVAAVLAEDLFTTRDGDLFARVVDAVEPTLVARDFVELTVSPGGRSAAIRAGAGPDGASGLVLWVDHRAVAVAGEPFFRYVAAVFDDGVSVVVSEARLAILGPDGATRRTWEGRCVRSVIRRGARIFFERCDAPNDALHGFDLASGTDVVLAEGHDFTFDVDPSGTYLAFTVVPLSGTSRELHAGRVAMP